MNTDKHFFLRATKKLVAVFIFFVYTETRAELRIPKNLTKADRQTALSILGYGSTSKILGDPFPLGGYSGVEMGIQTEMLQTERISLLGNGELSQGQTSYSTLTIGKGLYNNIDVMAQVSLLGQKENISNYGAQLRWGFFQASYFPIYMSTVFHWNTTNFSNLLVTNTYGMDLIAGFKAGEVTLYFGGGPVHTSGVFSGGTGGVTDVGETVKTSLDDTRFIAGVNVKIGNGFFAGEIDNYTSAVYSAKLGYRY